MSLPPKDQHEIVYYLLASLLLRPGDADNWFGQVIASQQI